MDEQPLYKLEDLSGEANFALCYAMALLGGEGSQAFRDFQYNQGRLKMSAHDKRMALFTGISELMERGIIEGERDGEGDYVPTVLHLELLDIPPKGLVLLV